MYINLLNDHSFFNLLLKIDEDILNQARQSRCPHCGGLLDRADYRRKPRGEPDGLKESFYIKFSLCCRKDGCRKRKTPGSVRFFGRVVWVAPLFFIASILAGDCGNDDLDKLRKKLSLSKRVVKRWRHWWNVNFTQTKRWTVIRGIFGGEPTKSNLPNWILDRVKSDYSCLSDAIVNSLKCLSYQDI